MAKGFKCGSSFNEEELEKLLEEQLNGKLSTELLWENASPSSSMNETDIAITVPEGVELFLLDIETGGCIYQLARLDSQAIVSSVFFFNGNRYVVSRSFTVKPTSISVGTANIQHNNDLPSADNTRVVLRKLFAIKGV